MDSKGRKSRETIAAVLRAGGYSHTALGTWVDPVFEQR